MIVVWSVGPDLPPVDIGLDRCSSHRLFCRHWPARRACPRTAGAAFRESTMAKIIRTEPGAILSKAVEYHGFVYLPGITARDTKQDIKGQTADVLAQIDAMLEHHGTDKTRLLQAVIWVKDIKQ